MTTKYTSSRLIIKELYVFILRAANTATYMFPYGNIFCFLSAFRQNIPVREHLIDFLEKTAVIFPNGNILREALRYTPQQIGTLIRATRKSLGVTQKDLALTSGTGLRFVIDLEKGKETCEIGKALTILHTLGIKLTLTPPAPAKQE